MFGLPEQNYKIHDGRPIPLQRLRQTMNDDNDIDDTFSVRTDLTTLEASNVLTVRSSVVVR
jgi:hypothetical protein